MAPPRKEKNSRLLVVDASVARSAGDGNAAHPVSTNCRNNLQAVLTICHRAVFTGDIRDEWKKHASSFARGWQIRMNGMKKAHLPALSPSLHGDLLEKMISASDLSEKWRRVARKDILLVDAALQFDKIIVSLDDEARAAFAEIAREQPLLRDVIWVNPAHPEEDVIAWLEKGAPHDKTRTLGAYTAASHTTSKTPTRKK